MIVDSRVYSGLCSCGKEHEMVTRAAIIESGCMKKLDDILAEYGISGKRCALYGENSYAATSDRHPRAEQEIILKSQGLHANEISTAEVLEKLESDVEVILAIGSGTIHDIARYCAYERGIRFVSLPTAASVDGFCSTVAAMTWHGYKKTMTAVAPEIVVADTDVVKNAPVELVRSGIGDIMAKYTALAEWRIANMLTGEYLCPVIFELMAKAADTAMDSVDGILKGEDSAFENVTYALVMSGIAMQMMGNSRPASGAEHHISHMIEMEPEAFEVKFPALHGEKTGVGTILASKEYYRLADIEDIAPYAVDYVSVTDEKLSSFFGERLAQAVISENKNDSLAAVSKEKLIEQWPEIRKIIRSIPKPEELYALLEKLGAKRELEEIGVSSEKLPVLLEYSPLVRNRLTLMRMRRMINI
ncbi:MAG: sn-glycerol-1-phosphate dehydrogenase [Oscillospiraceae bacterium]|nr:sn-glycerol-1-phosphate dehydrogenase [Oscillospiraceae bacterium]